jgi:hypothetical protein
MQGMLVECMVVKISVLHSGSFSNQVYSEDKIFCNTRVFDRFYTQVLTRFTNKRKVTYVLIEISKLSLQELKNRLYRSYIGMVNMLKAKNINRKYKATTYKTLIKPVLMYGAETWVLSKAGELRLGVFEREVLRRIYGPICEEATWRSRYNEEIYCLYGEIDLVTTIKITRLRWACHIVRMQDNLPCKKITLDKPEGRR